MRRDGTLFQTATSSCHAPPPPPPAPPFTLLPPSIRALLRPAGLEQIRDGRVVAGAPVQAGVHALPPTEDERAALPEHVFVGDGLDGGEILRGRLQVLVELPPAPRRARVTRPREGDRRGNPSAQRTRRRPRPSRCQRAGLWRQGRQTPPVPWTASQLPPSTGVSRSAGRATGPRGRPRSRRPPAPPG